MKKVKKIVFLLFVVLSLMMISSIYANKYITSYSYADVIGPGGYSNYHDDEDLLEINKALIRFIIVLIIIILVISVLLVRFIYDRYQIEIRIKDKNKTNQLAYETGESTTEKIIHDEDLKSEDSNNEKKENENKNIQIELDMRSLFAIMLMIIGGLIIFYFVNNG